MIYLLSFLAFWLACGFVAAGWKFAFFQTEWPRIAERDRKKDAMRAWKDIYWGLIALGVNSGMRLHRHGWRKWW